MKKIILFLIVAPTLCFAQKYEFSLQGGVSLNTLPGTAKEVAPSTGLSYKSGGVNPVAQASVYYLASKSIKIGCTLRYMSTSGQVAVFSHGNDFSKGKFSKQLFQVLPEVSYRILSLDRLALDAGLQAGASLHIEDKAKGIGYFPLSNSGTSILGFSAGVNLSSRYMVSKGFAVFIGVNPIYNLLSAPSNLDYTSTNSSSNSTFCIPVSAGFGFSF